MAQIEAEVAERLPESDKTAGNLLLGAAGLFLIVPWFFMDLKGADKIEVKALQRRYNSLGIFVAEKKCMISGDQEAALESTDPDAEAMKAEIAALKKELENKVQTQPKAKGDELTRTLNDISDSDVATTGDEDKTQM